MLMDRILFFSRTVLLLGLLIFFIVSLGNLLLQERQRNRLPSKPASETDYDRGIRVLLTDRSEKRNWHRRLDILILQACILYCPDDTERQILLDPQQTVTILSDLDGMHIDCNEQEENWPVTQIDIVPHSAMSSDHPTAALLNSGVAFEARDRKAVFTLNRTRYRGSLSIIRQASQKLMAVNYLPIESYLEGVVPSEMPAKYPYEALLAQAIASRSYAHASILEASKPGEIKEFDVYDTIRSQEYLGITKETPNTTIAVQKTAGRVLTYNNSFFKAFFSASSGGQTTPISIAFPEATGTDGFTPLDGVMVGKQDPYCLQGAEALTQKDIYWRHEVYLKPKTIKDSIRRWLKANNDTRNIGWVQDIIVSNNLPGRVETISIQTSEQGVEFQFTGHEFRTDIIGPHVIRSTYWEKDCPRWDEERKSWHIISYGRGHGVGMSQVSAYAMAKLHNMSAQQILAFFYHNAKLTQCWKPVHE